MSGRVTVNRKRVQRLMQVMGITALPTARACDRAAQPSLVYRHDLPVDDQRLWLPGGHHGLVLAWRLSNTLAVGPCVEALQEALARYRTPGIFNSDQGSQLTSSEFTGVLQAHRIAISMDGRGRWRDNVFIERQWKSVKYEDIYLKAYASLAQAGPTQYFAFYNGHGTIRTLTGATLNAVYYSMLPFAAAA